jgi:hypothetical protein
VSYVPVGFRSFGNGLNLTDKEDAVSEADAIDARNVTFTTRGAVQSRDGYAAFTSPALTNRVATLDVFYTSTGTKQLLAGCGTRLEGINTSGAVVASATALTSGATWDFARFGAPGSEVAYAGNANDTIRKWSGAAWSAPANMPKAGSLAVMAVDAGNRLVAGRFEVTTGGPTGGASTSNPSRVYFSNPGDPETWGINNYVDFTPGDGEKVQAVIAWREFTLIFKETKFFVVYGTSTDATGNPVFNYRTIDAGVGCASPRAVCALADGVYFMDRRGVYRTTGSEPQLVSHSIDPIFLGGSTVYYTGGALNHAQIALCAMWSHEQRVYLAFPSGTGTSCDRLLVYDTIGEWWSIFDIPASCGTSFRISDQAELCFGYAAGSNHIGRSSSSQTSDAGAAIISWWRSGWFDYELTIAKTIRESKLWGSGAPSVGIAKDYEVGTPALTAVPFGTSSTTPTWGGSFWGSTTWADGAVAVSSMQSGLVRNAVRGTVFSTYLYSNTLSQPWAIHRLAHHLREERIPSATSS